MFHKAKVSLSSPQIGELSLDCRRRSLIPSTQTLFLKICQLYFPHSFNCISWNLPTLFLTLCQLYFLKSANYISHTLLIEFLDICQLYSSQSVNCICWNLPTLFLWFSQHVFQKSKVSLSSAQIGELNLDCRRRSLIPSTAIPASTPIGNGKNHIYVINQVNMLCIWAHTRYLSEAPQK